jgi:hypothetical protein
MLSISDSGARLQRRLGAAGYLCGASLCHHIAQLLESILLRFAPAARRRALQPGPGRSRTALLLVDVQPEWYTQSQISQIFPGLRETIPRLLAMCRAAGSAPPRPPCNHATLRARLASRATRSSRKCAPECLCAVSSQVRSDSAETTAMFERLA